MGTQAASTSCNAPEPSERSQLLGEAASIKSPQNVHYRNITGLRFWWSFGCIMFGSLLAFFDSTLMVSSHPVITSHFNASNASSWLSTVFYLTSTVSQPLYGRISDAIGRKSVLLFAVTVFFFSTAWCAVAQDIGSFIAARAFCGLGAGGITSLTVILISDLVKLEYRGMYQSYYNIAWGCGNGLGAALGGLLCDRLGWRAAFAIQLPFILIDGCLVLLLLPSGLGPCLAQTGDGTIFGVLGDFDAPGAITLTAATTALILGLNLGGNVFSWTHPFVLASFIVFVVAISLLIHIERQNTKRPILPLSFLSTFPVANLMWSNFFSAIITNTVLFNVPIFLQAVKQFSPTKSGLYLFAPLIAASAAGVFSGIWITWTRSMKPLMLTGAVFFLVGGICVTFLDENLPSWALLLLVPATSIGQGLNWPPTTIALLALNSQETQAVVSTTLGLLRYIGSILGVAISSWIFQNALVVSLDDMVIGPSETAKQHIIRLVRESIKVIASLDPDHKSQVVDAYQQALRLTFSSTIFFSVLVVCLTIPLKLPTLSRKPSASPVPGGAAEDE